MSTTRVARVTLTTLASALALLLTTCAGPAGDICDVVCACIDCNDRERDLCLVNENQELDRAAAYDCADEYALYLDCITTEAMCTTGVFEHSAECTPLYEDYYTCIEDASDRFGS